jgi:hypothetical protein
MKSPNHKRIPIETNYLRIKDDTMIFFTEVHLLAGKLVIAVAMHSLGGSRANWHHTLNPQ